MTVHSPETSERFRAFFRENLEYVVKSLRRLGVAGGDSEDVAHELFLAVHQRFAEVDPTRPARPYLFAFARRYAAAYRNCARTRHEGAPPSSSSEPADPRPHVDQELLRREQHELVYSALDELAAERREAFVMFEIDERSLEDIAKELEVPLTTIVSRLRLGRRDFEAAIKRLTAKSRHVAPSPARTEAAQ